MTGTLSGRAARIVFIMPRHTHDDARVAHKEAWSLKNHGYEVVLLCKHAPVPYYLGMRVIAARARAQGLLRPVLNLPYLLRQALRLKADLYFLQNPDTLLIGFLLLCMRKRVIYSTQEDFVRKVEIHPDVPRPLTRLIGRAIAAGEFLMARITSATVVTQSDVERRYAPYATIVVNAPLTNGPIVRRAQQLYSELPTSDIPTLVYAGRITHNRGLNRMLELLARLNEIRPWRLKLMGQFLHEADLTTAEKHKAWGHVDYLGQVPHAVSLAQIRSADIGLAILDDVGGYSRTSITKLYEYMQMETPFVASDFKVWRDSINDTPAGLFVEISDMALLTQQTNGMLADRASYEKMQAYGRQFIERSFNWHLVSADMQDTVNELLQPVGVR